MSTSAVNLDLRTISERYFAAWEARDPDAIVALHTPDTRFQTHAGGDPVHGRDAVRETFAGLFAQFPQLGFDVHRVLFGASHWTLDWTLTFDGPDGRRLGFDCIDAVEVSPEGLVARKDTFFDFVQLQAALPELAATAGAQA
jgi:ketosteroid isomerase-like protein